MSAPNSTSPGPSLAHTLLIFTAAGIAGMIGWAVLITFAALFTRFCVFVWMWAWHLHIPFTR